jgi:predicted alpha/beta-hydrolase family hydrolase
MTANNPRKPGTRLTVALVTVLVLMACTESEPTGASPGATSRESSVGPQPTAQPTDAAEGAYREVEFTTRDGDPRSGRLFGDGPVAVVLTHMGRVADTQDDWQSFAEELADNGHQALTYERERRLRDVSQDVLGAADYLRGNGAEKVIVAGASIGAMASLYVATLPEANVDGVIWLAGVLRGNGYDFRDEDIAEIASPMLFISGDQDVYGAADAARQLHDWATAPSELVILDSRQHGTDMFTDSEANARTLTETMLGFVEGLGGAEGKDMAGPTRQAPEGDRQTPAHWPQ